MLQTRKSKLKFFLFAYWHDSRWEKFVGATVKICDLSQNLAELENDVTIFLPKLGFDNNSDKLRIIEIPFLNLSFIRSLSFNICLSFILIVFFLKNRADVVWTRRMGSIIPGLYARLSRSIFFFEINDDPYRKDFNEGSRVFFKLQKFLSEWQDEINIFLCHKAFVITKEILNKIKKRNPGISDNKLEEMPSGANVELFKPLDKQQCRTRLGLDLNKKYIGFIGTLLKHQGVDILIKAAPSIIKKVPSSIFLIIGEGPMKEIWISDVRTMGIKDHFIFTGQVEYKEVPIWIGSSDLCVAPFKKNSGFRSPVKIFDYMSCGKPIVASNIRGTTENFLSSNTILLVEPEQPDFLADAILDILTNEKKYEKMGSKGRSLILEKYDRKIMANKITSIARNILNYTRC
jgi:glycosyltransferase involved in cell wall biosynthesis